MAEVTEGCIRGQVTRSHCRGDWTELTDGGDVIVPPGSDADELAGCTLQRILRLGSSHARSKVCLQ